MTLSTINSALTAPQTPASTPNVTDFNQFAALRAGADRHDPRALRAAAQQFEALLTENLLKTARETKFGDDLTGEQGDFYNDLFDQQMALHLASGKGLGLADMLVRQLGGAAPPVKAGTGFGPSAPGTLRPMSTAAPAQTGSTSTQGATDTRGSGSSKTADINDPQWRAKSPEDFVAAIRPHAEKAAAALGVPARALIAQAALETGWGQKIGRNSSGCTGFNLFGVKTGAGWTGTSASQSTSEFQNGAWTRENAAFRSYPSIGAAFDDYVNVLCSNPRYADALRAGSVEGFAQGLQSAGYATDPAYAQKLVRVASSVEMSSAIGASQAMSA